MRDYNFIEEGSGKRVPVAQLPTSFIRELLSGELYIVHSDGEIDPICKVKKRLELELLIRQLGLR